MENTDVIEKMLGTIMSDQKTLFGEVRQIKDSMVKMLIIEEKQLNQKEALSRLGKHVDHVDKRVTGVEQKLQELEIVSAKLAVKISLISGGSGAGVATVGGVLWLWFSNGHNI